MKCLATLNNFLFFLFIKWTLVPCLRFLEKQKETKLGKYKKLAYLVRDILVDHPFSDGNKRTAMFLAFAEENKKQVDRELLLQQIISIDKNNLTNIRNIEWRLKNAIR